MDYYDEESYGIDEDTKDDYEDEDGDDLDKYKTPTDEDLEILGSKGGKNDDYDIEEDDGYGKIDTGAEWRDFADDGPSKSRVGMARATDIDEDLSTMVMDDRFNKLERISRTPEDIFRAITMDTVNKYNLSKGHYDDCIRIMQLINKQNKKLKYKNPKAIVFSLLIITDNKIDKSKLDKVYEDKAKHEKMSKLDLLRYCIFVIDLKK